MSGGAQISAGRVGRPHGLDGGFYVTGARPRLLTVGAAVLLGDRHLSIERRSGTDRHPILHLAGVEDRDTVAALRGLEIEVSLEQAPALGEGEWWAHQLEGCLVRDGEREIGTVARLLELPSCEVLEVRREQGEALLVPMVKDAIRSVDVEQRRIDVDLGFLGEQA
jgi:16S rRNA processing protein RimM